MALIIVTSFVAHWLWLPSLLCFGQFTISLKLPTFHQRSSKVSGIFAPFDDALFEQSIIAPTATYFSGALAGLIVSSFSAVENTQAADASSVLLLGTDLSIPTGVTFDGSIFFNGFVSGAAINVAKNIILHPIETAKNRLDMGAKEISLDGLYDGIVPAMVGGVPAAAVFFGAKDVIRDVLRHLDVAPGAATILAVTLATGPYWLLRNPSEVIKTRLRVKTGQPAFSLRDIIMKGQISDLYSGLTSNVLYALPTDWLKFLFYEYFARTLFHLQEGQMVDGLTAIVCGGLGALVAETAATPLDVARTRIMCLSDGEGCPVEVEGQLTGTSTSTSAVGSSSDSTPKPNPLVVVYDIIRQEKLSTLFAGAGPRSARALLDGAVQFCAYESTQNLLHSLM